MIPFCEPEVDFAVVIELTWAIGSEARAGDLLPRTMTRTQTLMVAVDIAEMTAGLIAMTGHLPPAPMKRGGRSRLKNGRS